MASCESSLSCGVRGGDAQFGEDDEAVYISGRIVVARCLSQERAVPGELDTGDHRLATRQQRGFVQNVRDRVKSQYGLVVVKFFGPFTVGTDGIGLTKVRDAVLFGAPTKR